MLTRALLLHRTRAGKLRPLFIDPKNRALLTLAEELLSLATHSVGESADVAEERVSACAGQFERPRVAQGLAKLVLDRLTVEEPAPERGEARLSRLREAIAVLRAQPADVALETYEAALEARFGEPLEALREQLYADLPGRRRVLSFDGLSAAQLLARYNLALAQGPLLTAKRVSVRVLGGDVLRVRRVLRWLRFCRLVAEVRPVGEDWLLEVEGPAALFTQQKRYGLQLASFLTVLPSLQRWELTAQVQQGRKQATLYLNHEDPLESPHASALGHIPEEVASLAKSLQAEGFTVDTTPAPRHTGARGMCVPDFAIKHPEGRELAFELFHPWHAAALVRRLEELASRPDPALRLGVDRAVARDDALKAKLDARSDVFLFNGFPSARTLKPRLLEWLGAQGA